MLLYEWGCGLIVVGVVNWTCCVKEGFIFNSKIFMFFFFFYSLASSPLSHHLLYFSHINSNSKEGKNNTAPHRIEIILQLKHPLKIQNI